MQELMQISLSGLSMAKNYESLGPRNSRGEFTNVRTGRDGIRRWYPYQGKADAKNIWTAGYGHVCSRQERERYDVTGITEQEAVALLHRDMADAEAAVRKNAPWCKIQHQFDALCLLAMNNGGGILQRGKSMGDALRTGDRRKICTAFMPYICSGLPLKPCNGLARRVVCEAALYWTGVYKMAATSELALDYLHDLIASGALDLEDHYTRRVIVTLGGKP